jgi:hypothetical protein
LAASSGVQAQDQASQSNSGQSNSSQSNSSQPSSGQSSSSGSNSNAPGQDQSPQNQANQSQSSQAPPSQAPPNSDQQKDQSSPQQQAPQSAQPPDQSNSQAQPQTQPQTQAPANPPENPQPNNSEPNNPAAAVAEATKRLGEVTLVKVRDWETEWLIGAYVSRNRPLAPLSREGREEFYLHQTFLTPGAYLARLFDASIDQARGSPQQWGGGIGGYSERFASREGQFFASNSLAALGDAKLRYEPRYDQCKCQGFWPRAKHAVLRNLLTYNETKKELRPQWALYGGAFAGGMIATSWKPKTHNVFAEGGVAALEQAGFGAAENLFIEFAVDINRKLGVDKVGGK